MAAVAFGMYPHLNVADAHLTVVVDGVQHCLHVSKTLHSDRANLRVGPVSIEIVEPLWELRVVVDEQDGLAADLRFRGLHFPIEEPRFVHRFGPRTFMDYTRMSQATSVSGFVAVDGQRMELGSGAFGLRDRSWGIRPTGLPDPQPHQPPLTPQFYWLWAPVRLPGRTLFWHVNADEHGRAWNTRATICPDGSATAADHVHASGDMTLSLAPGTRWADGATLRLLEPGTPDVLELRYRPRTHLEMQGLGYRHPEWAHGTPHGELASAREALTLVDAEPGALHRWHRQVLCDVEAAGGAERGVAILEHLIIGEYAPLGL